MLHDFLITNRNEIIARARQRVAARTSPGPTDVELENGIPLFLNQLGDALQLALSGAKTNHSAIMTSAAHHGQELLRLGLTVAQVVHDYGDLCQVVTDLAVEQDASISAEEFRTFNLCLDDAIAGAVTEYGRQQERTRSEEETERLGVICHELRNALNVALLSFDIIKKGLVGPSGTTGNTHGRSLMRIRELIDRSLSQVRLESGVLRLERVSVARFIEEVEIGASIQARAKRLHFAVGFVDPTLTVAIDQQTLASAVSNLLHNAFKFTRPCGHVALTIRTTATRVWIDVADECGGLPPGKAEELFRPFEQRGADRTGLGLGLSISAKAAKANGGELYVRDLPGKGCVFSIELPRVPPPPLSLVEGGKTTPLAEPAGAAEGARRGEEG